MIGQKRIQSPATQLDSSVGDVDDADLSFSSKSSHKAVDPKSIDEENVSVEFQDEDIPQEKTQSLKQSSAKVQQMNTSEYSSPQDSRK